MELCIDLVPNMFPERSVKIHVLWSQKSWDTMTLDIYGARL